jgi:hypothetical protein
MLPELQSLTKNVDPIQSGQMGGSLTCTSPGRGQGAILTIDLPFTPQQARE